MDIEVYKTSSHGMWLFFYLMGQLDLVSLVNGPPTIEIGLMLIRTKKVKT